MDVLVNHLTVISGGKTLLENANLKLTHGRKYGLIGRNGIGKTTLLNMIARKEVEGFPQHLHVLHVEQEIEPEDKSVLQHILECDTERSELLKRLDDLLNIDETKLKKRIILENTEKIEKVQLRLIEIEAHEAEPRASQILSGLGFSQDDLSRKSNTFSGGWRMRISLAKALFSNPDILLLDEPTNHLDLDAVLWLEDYVQSLEITVIIVSHARDFLNNVAEEIIHFHDQQLMYFKGNYDQFEKTRTEMMRNQKKQMEGQTRQQDHLQKFIDKFRYNAKRASLVQSRIKALNRMDIIDEISEDPTCVFQFPDPEMLTPPLLRLTETTIGYGEGHVICEDVTIDINMESRYAIVGPNGAGKTTLLKTLTGELSPIDGLYYQHQRLRIGLFTQHHVDTLDLRLSAQEQMIELFGSLDSQEYRGHLGAFGLSGNLAIRPMYLLSGGQKSRVALSLITWKKPHILVLDEPTNHLDIDAINALIIALENFKGGLIIVSHDQYFVSALCSHIYTVNHGKVEKFDGDFNDYKELIIKKK
jgi:ATP-binding cassette subfamily F protein 3